MSRPLQTTIDGRTVDVVTRGGRKSAAAAHEPERLFEPAPAQIPGQKLLELGSDGMAGTPLADSGGCLTDGSAGTPS